VGGEPTILTEPLCGRDLPRVVRIKSHRGDKLSGIEITVACDVSNPLFGDTGAARVFGRQKGATDAQINLFDEWLRLLAIRCNVEDIALRPGAGAAGGLGFGMMAFFAAGMRPGAELTIDATRLRDRLRGADLCITGEGRFDAASMAGKMPVRVAAACREAAVPCAAIFGCYDDRLEHPFRSLVSVRERTQTEAEAIARAEEFLAEASEQLAADASNHSA